jgi:hypothetical protein
MGSADIAYEFEFGALDADADQDLGRLSTLLHNMSRVWEVECAESSDSGSG